MRGQVVDGVPVLEVTLLLPGQPFLNIEAAIDTGFAGFLTLPLAAIRALKLPFFYKMPANLADDSNIMVEVYTATILWHEEELEVEILGMGKRPLLGRALLRGSEACIPFADHSIITVDLL